MYFNHTIFSIRIIRNHLFKIKRAISKSVPINRTIQQQDELVLKPLKYMRSVVEQKYSTSLEVYSTFNHWFKVPEDKREAICEVMRTYHCSCLLMDDTVDAPPYRHSMLPSQAIYGEPLSINSSYFAIYKTLEMTSNLDPKAIQLYMEAGQQFCRGQGIEIYWRDHLTCPSEEDYINMIKNKSSNLLVLAYKLYQLCSDYEVNCMKFANTAGIYHQLVNDYLGLFASQNSNMKSNFTDIAEGKFTLPIIHALEHTDSPDEIMNILKQRKDDPELLKMFQSLLEKAGSIEYTKDFLYKLEKELQDEIKILGGNPELLNLIENLNVWKQATWK